MPMDFNKFTEKAQEVLMIAQGLLQRYQQAQMDTDHLLLALFEQPDGTVPKVLAGMNVDTIRLAEQIKASLERAPKVQGSGIGQQAQIYTTPRRAAGAG